MAIGNFWLAQGLKCRLEASIGPLRPCQEDDYFFLENFEWIFCDEGLILRSLEAAGAI
jgi:hypothetical protein